MKKVAIVTHYFRSINYGGNLQAYALCKAFEKFGCQAEQICYPLAARHEDRICSISLRNRINITLFKLISVARKLIQKRQNSYYIHAISDRKSSFIQFNQEVIPNSHTVFDDNHFTQCIQNYDVFITGSDQVWNLKMYRPEFFLSSVPSQKVKASYAASMAMDSLSENQESFIREKLCDFNQISVRERTAQDMIQKLVKQHVYLVADPTMLLSQSDWDDQSSARLVKDDYVFCYFLGNNLDSRKIAKEVAKRGKYKLIGIPMYNNGVTFLDSSEYDISFASASPADFISLIKHANYVFTDSFHACVFSYIYKKSFVVFNRDKKNSMSTRIDTLMEICGTKNRYINKRITLDEVMSFIDLPIKETEQYTKLVDQSFEYIKMVLAEEEHV